MPWSERTILLPLAPRPGPAAALCAPFSAPTGPAIHPDELAFEIVANAFLYRMVRRLVGFLVAIGQGMQPPEALRECLESSPPALVQSLAPPHGLTLVEVIYRDNLQQECNHVLIYGAGARRLAGKWRE